MGEMEKLVKVVKLMAKTGLYFASCDGNYDQKEKDFLEAYVSGIEVVGAIDEEMKKSVYSAFDKTYSLDEIVGETQEVVEGFDADDRDVILSEIQKFINKVIRVDGCVDSKEQEEYKKWKAAFGLD